MTKETLKEQFLEWLRTCPVEVTFVQDNSSEGYVGYAVDFELNPNPHKEGKQPVATSTAQDVEVCF